MGLSYDRRVPEQLLKALEPGGFAHSLVEFGGSGMWALDMQLRGLGEAKKQHRATLYVGTTKVIDLHLKGQLFALSASPTLAREANGWAAAWEQWHNDRWFADQRAEVDNYLQEVIEKIIRKGTYVKEGMVQAAIGRFRFNRLYRHRPRGNRVLRFAAGEGCLQERAGRQVAECLAQGRPARVVEDQADEARRRMRCACGVQQGRGPCH